MGKSKSQEKRVFRSPEERDRILSAYRSSGQTAREFSEQAGISYGTLMGWLAGGQAKKRRQAARHKKREATGTKRTKPGPYSPEQRRQAVEAFLKSGMSLRDFGKLWGVSGPNTLQKWVKLYQEKGPQALEGGHYGKGRKRGPAGTPPALKNAIVETRLANPSFGLRSVKDLLWRFGGVKVSTGTVRKVLKEKQIAPQPVKRKRRRNTDKVRRFERAKPMQLWQSDITSYVLARHGTRVYLTVFMDDHSRYVVSWALGLQQTSEFVIEAIQGGIQRFGKPEETLTDQGRQYFAWRGKSTFQKFLKREGIEHVISRAHHPETLGKCERFWETVEQEFWSRAKPQDLQEARERFKHFVDHYNHFRPHQGIGGVTPADRFFGLESEVRKAIEATVERNAVLLATGEKPRVPVFLIGQVGDQKVSLHGEDGKLVLQTDELSRTIETHRFGHVARGFNPETEKGNENEDGEREPVEVGRSDGTNDASGAQSGTVVATQGSHVEGTAQALSAAADTCDPGEGALATGDARATGAGPQGGACDHGVLAGADPEGGPGQTTPGAAAQNLAAVTAGAFGYGGRVVSATEVESRPDGSAVGESGRQSEKAQSADRGAGTNGPDAGPVDCDHPGAAGREAAGPAASIEAERPSDDGRSREEQVQRPDGEQQQQRGEDGAWKAQTGQTQEERSDNSIIGSSSDQSDGSDDSTRGSSQ